MIPFNGIIREFSFYVRVVNWLLSGGCFNLSEITSGLCSAVIESQERAGDKKGYVAGAGMKDAWRRTK